MTEHEAYVAFNMVPDIGAVKLGALIKRHGAQFLHDGSEIRIRNPPNNHGQSGELKPVGGLSLPMLNPDVVVPVIEFFL